MKIVMLFILSLFVIGTSLVSGYHYFDSDSKFQNQVDQDISNTKIDDSIVYQDTRIVNINVDSKNNYEYYSNFEYDKEKYLNDYHYYNYVNRELKKRYYYYNDYDYYKRYYDDSRYKSLNIYVINGDVNPDNEYWYDSYYDHCNYNSCYYDYYCDSRDCHNSYYYRYYHYKNIYDNEEMVFRSYDDYLRYRHYR